MTKDQAEELVDEQDQQVVRANPKAYCVPWSIVQDEHRHRVLFRNATLMPSENFAILLQLASTPVFQYGVTVLVHVQTAMAPSFSEKAIPLRVIGLRYGATQMPILLERELTIAQLHLVNRVRKFRAVGMTQFCRSRRQSSFSAAPAGKDEASCLQDLMRACCRKTDSARSSGSRTTSPMRTTQLRSTDLVYEVALLPPTEEAFAMLQLEHLRPPKLPSCSHAGGGIHILDQASVLLEEVLDKRPRWSRTTVFDDRSCRDVAEGQVHHETDSESRRDTMLARHRVRGPSKSLLSLRPSRAFVQKSFSAILCSNEAFCAGITPKDNIFAPDYSSTSEPDLSTSSDDETSTAIRAAQTKHLSSGGLRRGKRVRADHSSEFDSTSEVLLPAAKEFLTSNRADLHDTRFVAPREISGYGPDDVPSELLEAIDTGMANADGGGNDPRLKMSEQRSNVHFFVQKSQINENHRSGAARRGTHQKNYTTQQERSPFLQALTQNRVVLLEGATGSGKSTLAPLILAHHQLQVRKMACRIAVTQPRRDSARECARRINTVCGVEWNYRVTCGSGKNHFQRNKHTRFLAGTTTGTNQTQHHPVATYQISQDDQDMGGTSPIVFYTVGTLKQKLLRNPDLIREYSHIMLDEIHERSFDLDILCFLLRALLSDPSLCHTRLVLMSATLEAVRGVKRYFAPLGYVLTTSDEEDLFRSCAKTNKPEEVLDFEMQSKKKRQTTVSSTSSSREKASSATSSPVVRVAGSHPFRIDALHLEDLLSLLPQTSLARETKIKTKKAVSTVADVVWSCLQAFITQSEAASADGAAPVRVEDADETGSAAAESTDLADLEEAEGVSSTNLPPDHDLHRDNALEKCPSVGALADLAKRVSRLSCRANTSQNNPHIDPAEDEKMPAIPPFASSERLIQRLQVYFLHLLVPVLESLVEKYLSICREEGGKILIFLPTMGMLQRCEQLLRKSSSFFLSGKTNDGSSCFADLNIQHTLCHRDLAEEANHARYRPVPPGTVQLLLATNICETGDTLPQLLAVVDLGLQLHRRFDLRLGTERSQLRWATASAMDQRKGRAGRVQLGTCVRLFPKMLYDHLRLTGDCGELADLDLRRVLLEVEHARRSLARKIILADDKSTSDSGSISSSGEQDSWCYPGFIDVVHRGSTSTKRVCTHWAAADSCWKFRPVEVGEETTTGNANETSTTASASAFDHHLAQLPAPPNPGLVPEAVLQLRRQLFLDDNSELTLLGLVAMHLPGAPLAAASLVFLGWAMDPDLHDRFREAVVLAACIEQEDDPLHQGLPPRLGGTSSSKSGNLVPTMKGLRAFHKALEYRFDLDGGSFSDSLTTFELYRLDSQLNSVQCDKKRYEAWRRTLSRTAGNASRLIDWASAGPGCGRGLGTGRHPVSYPQINKFASGSRPPEGGRVEGSAVLARKFLLGVGLASLSNAVVYGRVDVDFAAREFALNFLSNYARAPTTIFRSPLTDSSRDSNEKFVKALKRELGTTTSSSGQDLQILEDYVSFGNYSDLGYGPSNLQCFLRAGRDSSGVAPGPTGGLVRCPNFFPPIAETLARLPKFLSHSSACGNVLRDDQDRLYAFSGGSISPLIPRWTWFNNAVRGFRGERMTTSPSVPPAAAVICCRESENLISTDSGMSVQILPSRTDDLAGAKPAGRNAPAQRDAVFPWASRLRTFVPSTRPDSSDRLTQRLLGRAPPPPVDEYSHIAVGADVLDEGSKIKVLGATLLPAGRSWLWLLASGHFGEDVVLFIRPPPAAGVEDEYDFTVVGLQTSDGGQKFSFAEEDYFGKNGLQNIKKFRRLYRQLVFLAPGRHPVTGSACLPTGEGCRLLRRELREVAQNLMMYYPREDRVLAPAEGGRNSERQRSETAQLPLERSNMPVTISLSNDPDCLGIREQLLIVENKTTGRKR
ncbi:unnamed protein product [Amoebophrya sp. A120]|nr:unnamed protein product [Amoebophrya sp. A120]|eukprot:GSA120T00024251001.1